MNFSRFLLIFYFLFFIVCICNIIMVTSITGRFQLREGLGSRLNRRRLKVLTDTPSIQDVNKQLLLPTIM